LPVAAAANGYRYCYSLLIYVNATITKRDYPIFETMQRVTRTIFLLCTLSVAGIIVLQLSWLRNYYQVNKDRFDKDVNLAFEDAVKKEFMVRCDTLENELYHFMMDTTQIIITSRWNAKYQRYQYIVTNKQDTTDTHQFSLKQINQPITSQQDAVKAAIAKHYARTYREEDLEKHIIYYNTQNLGKFIDTKTVSFNFDTARLGHYLAQYLRERDIHESFQFYLSDADSTLNKSNFPDSLHKPFPIITKAFPTYLVEKNRNYVRALFPLPARYLFHKMIWMLAGSLLLIGIVICSLYYLLRILQREKKLAAVKNDFISNITHELQTPITIVSGALEAMQDFEVLDDRAKTIRYINISRKEINRLSEMVGKIMNLAIYEKSDFKLKPTWVNVDHLIQTLIANYSMLKEKQVHFIFKSELSSPMIKADELHFYNALSNLVDNAIKYSGREPTIEIICSEEKGFLVIQVKDNGIGIPATEQAFIFNKFYRVPASSDSVKGHGLGLSYVKNIIHKHHGWCTVESKENTGSTFKLAIPHDQ
jgi:two-component system, OmpR family, phosphate regulon sensor histidine kinase PhoR